MQIMGHRGAAGLAPENTIAAIAEALAAHADWIEFDVRRTQDGHIVLVHDRSTRRIATKSLTIRKAGMEQLQALEMKRGESIPTLEEALEIIGSKAKVNIEVKSPDCVPQVVEMVQARIKKGRPATQFLISSFSPAVLRAAYKLEKHIPYGLLQIWPVRFRWLRSVKLSAVGFYHISALTPFIVALAKRKGIYTYAY